MRALYMLSLSLALAAAGSFKGQAGDKRADKVPVSKDAVSTMAQTFVSLHHDKQAERKSRLSFQDADIYAQDKPGKWAVLGGYMAFSSGKAPSPHAFGLTMQLICPRPDDPMCWRLEKLLIDQKLVVDK